MEPVIISIADKHRENKIHHFKFYNCGHSYYNQGCPYREFFYRRWEKIYPSYGFGYGQYFEEARLTYKQLRILCGGE
tara:strand:- start:284 stop:514 length:231 start_codon:yes stop_codon:yes gene_type:complete